MATISTQTGTKPTKPPLTPVRMKAAGLAYGDVIIEGKDKRTTVKSVDPCGAHRDHLHVNKQDCYWLHAEVTIGV
jgi:hypothetical protein